MTTRLSAHEYLVALERSAAQITELIESLDPQTAIPACPAWNLRELVAHVGGVHGWARGIIAGGSPKGPRPEPEGPLAPWYAGQANALVAALRESDPQREAWSFGTDRTVAFWIRRQAHETEMHRFDLAAAGGLDTSYDRALAADGVSEVLDVTLPRIHSKKPVPLRATIRLVATDTDDRWVLRPAERPSYVDYAHSAGGDGDQAVVTAAAPASDLVTGLWGRTPYDRWAIEGERDVLDTLMSSGVTP